MSRVYRISWVGPEGGPHIWRHFSASRKEIVADYLLTTTEPWIEDCRNSLGAVYFPHERPPTWNLFLEALEEITIEHLP